MQNDLRNFGDDNTISAVGRSVPELFDSLTLKSNVAIDWFQSNSVIVNPGKFKAVVFTKSKQDTSGIPISLKDHCINSPDTVKLLGITIIGCHLKKNMLVVSVRLQLLNLKASVLKRLYPYIAYEKTRKTLVQSSVLSHFNYCPLVWDFTTTKQLQKIEKIQGRALRFITDDYETSYEMLMTNTETTTMRANHMHTLCVEIYKTLSNLKPKYMQDLSERNP